MLEQMRNVIHRALARESGGARTCTPRTRGSRGSLIVQLQCLEFGAAPTSAHGAVPTCWRLACLLLEGAIKCGRRVGSGPSAALDTKVPFPPRRQCRVLALLGNRAPTVVRHLSRKSEGLQKRPDLHASNRGRLA